MVLRTFQMDYFEHHFGKNCHVLHVDAFEDGLFPLIFYQINYQSHCKDHLITQSGPAVILYPVEDDYYGLPH